MQAPAPWDDQIVMVPGEAIEMKSPHMHLNLLTRGSEAMPEKLEVICTDTVRTKLNPVLSNPRHCVSSTMGPFASSRASSGVGKGLSAQSTPIVHNTEALSSFSR